MFESRVESTYFVALRHSMATCIPRVDGLSTDPRVGASHGILFVCRQEGSACASVLSPTATRFEANYGV